MSFAAFLLRIARSSSRHRRSITIVTFVTFVAFVAFVALMTLIALVGPETVSHWSRSSPSRREARDR